MLNLNFQNGTQPPLNARNMNAIVESINTLQTQLANPFVFKGSCLYAELPETGNTINDTWYVTDRTCLYSWDGDSWETSSLSEIDYLQEFTNLKDSLCYVSAYDWLLPRGFVEVTEDLTITWDQYTKVATINGTATANQNSNITNPAFIEIPSYIRKFTICTEQTNENLYTDVYYKAGVNGTSTYLTQFHTAGFHDFTLPSNATHVLIRLRIYSGNTFTNDTYSLYMTNVMSAKEAYVKALAAAPDCIQIKNFASGEYNPPQDFFSVPPTGWTSYCLPSWFTNTFPNLRSDAAVMPLKFGKNGTQGAGFVVGRDPLRLVVTTHPTSTTWNAASTRLVCNHKEIVFFGDSITYGRNGESSTAQQVDNPFPKQIGINLGIRSVNFGVGSQGYLATGGGKTALQELQSHDLTPYDYVVFGWGVNDWNVYTTEDIQTAFEQCVDYLYRKNPSCVLIVLGIWNSPSYGQPPKYKYGVEKMVTINNNMKTYCDTWGIPFIGMDDCPFNGKNMESYYSSVDGKIHPTENGYKMIGNWLTGKIGSLIG